MPLEFHHRREVQHAEIVILFLP